MKRAIELLIFVGLVVILGILIESFHPILLMKSLRALAI